MPSLEEHVRALRKENETLREQIRQLQDDVTNTCPFPERWKLTKVQADMLAILVNREFVSTASFATLLYGDRNDPPSDTTIKVQISKMRQRLSPFGIVIGTRIRQGYFLTSDVRARFKLRSAA